MKNMIKTLTVYALITLLTAVVFASCEPKSADPVSTQPSTIATPRSSVTSTTTSAPTTTTTVSTTVSTTTTTTATSTTIPTTTTVTTTVTTLPPTTIVVTASPTTVTTTMRTTTTTATTTTKATTTTTKPPRDLPAPSAEALRVWELVNIEREKAGLDPLYYCYDAQLAANIRSDEIDVRFSHTRPDGTSCSTVADEVGLDDSLRLSGENIAWGYESPEDVMNGWMNSEGHRENILRDWFDGITIGYDPETLSWVQLFVTDATHSCH